MAEIETIGAADFKAKCLHILDRISRRELQQVVVTKRGVAVAVVTAPAAEAAKVERLHGFLRGSVVIPSGTDLTAPILEEPFAAEQGEWHR
jgi:antitoxin (DNA-binding transcriptional repressor) of toxin-antitoxin stability system